MKHVGITTFFLILLAVFIGAAAGVVTLSFKAIVSYPAITAAVVAAIAVYFYRKGK